MGQEKSAEFWRVESVRPGSAQSSRLRWLWPEWTDPDRPWVDIATPCNVVDRQLIKANTIVTLGDGGRASFSQST